MKFTVECTDLKKAADKAMAVISKSAALNILHCVTIATGNNCIIMSATNVEQFVEIEVDATVIEPGVAYIHKDDIKKVYGLSDMVTIEVKDGQFNVKGAKKKSAVPVQDYKEEDAFVFPEMKEAEIFMDIDNQRLIQTLSSLSCFISTNETNKMMTGYNFDGKAKRIAALDGHRIGFRRMPEDFMTEKSIIVPGVVYAQLKKISTAKNDKLKVLASDKYIEFIGKDFKLYSRLLEGDYYRIDQMIDMCYDYQLVINPKELYKLGKEYYGVAKNSNKPMYFTYDKELDVVRTGISTPGYITVDELETVDKKKSVGLEKDFVYGFNPLYIYEAMQLYNDEVKCCGVIKKSQFGCMITPIVFDDNEYLSLVLPVNIAVDNANKFMDYLKTA